MMKGRKMKKLYPNLYYTKVEEITIETLIKNKIKLLILDVDNTLIDYYKNLSEEVKKWAKETEKAIGKHIAFVLDDTVITNPKVNARIENGVFQISLPHGYEFKKHI